MSRIHKLEKLYQEPLKEKNINDASVFIQGILNADITKGKYARFLIKAFLNDKFLEEDLIGGMDSTIGQAISLFDKHKGKLPLEHRSVYALDKETGEALYQSPGDLWNGVKQFQGELSGKELKREEQEKIYRETEFIYKDEETGFQIISPLTKESAQWWGKGTRWCTSAENNNQFDYYTKQAPLLILLMPGNNGEKLQLWKNKDDIQFMDEVDNRVSLDYIKENWKILEPICRWLNNLKYIPEKYITKELCELAIRQDENALQYIPKKLMTKKLCELAIKKDGWTLQYIPEDLITKELCKIAVKNNGYALCHILEKYRTKELYTMAIQQNGLALVYIQKGLRTKEICEIAVKQNGLAIKFVPEEFKTPELYELAVKGDGQSLAYISEDFKTLELCEIGVKQNGISLHYVPYQYRDKLKHYVKDEIKHCIKDVVFELPIKKYKETFQEIKTFFPKKDISLSYHHL